MGCFLHLSKAIQQHHQQQQQPKKTIDPDLFPSIWAEMPFINALARLLSHSRTPAGIFIARVFALFYGGFVRVELKNTHTHTHPCAHYIPFVDRIYLVYGMYSVEFITISEYARFFLSRLFSAFLSLLFTRTLFIETTTLHWQHEKQMQNDDLIPKITCYTERQTIGVRYFFCSVQFFSFLFEIVPIHVMNV